MAIRVRFAPSPTGLLHIGNARTALINWLFARHHALKGMDATLLLRLDDTDQTRSDPVYARAIENDLQWLGLTHEDFARQSDRFDRYGAAIDQLKNSGRLYACYETADELDFKRKQQLARHESPLYDRKSLTLSEVDKHNFEAKGRQPHWRFRLLDKTVHWNDLTRGPTEFQGAHLSDPVLVRADGAYLYTLTSVVDDIDFNTTHIIRGEDHVTNTAVQIQLFEALGKKSDSESEPLSFAHTTLLTGADGAGLSKRLGSLSLQSLREKGVEAMAINSLLARLGTSLPIEPHVTLDDLAASFDLSTFSRTSPRFDPVDLNMLNHKLLQIMPFDSIQNRFPVRESDFFTPNLWNIVKGNVYTLHDVKQWHTVCTGEITPVISDVAYIAQSLSCLPDEPWTTQTWGEWTQKIKELTGRKGRELFMPLRQALTGQDHGPEMKDLLPFIGHAKTKKRLEGCA